MPQLNQGTDRSSSVGHPHRILTQLTRLAQRRDQARAWLDQALLKNLDVVAPVALEVAVEIGDPLGRVLAGRVDDLSLELTLRLMSRCNDREHEASLPLRELALELNRRCLDVHRDLWPELDEEQTKRLATEHSDRALADARSRDAWRRLAARRRLRKIAGDEADVSDL